MLAAAPSKAAAGGAAQAPGPASKPKAATAKVLLCTHCTATLMTLIDFHLAGATDSALWWYEKHPLSIVRHNRCSIGYPLTDELTGQAPGPGKAPARDAADIIDIIEARAGAVTRRNTLFLAGVGPRVDWVADLGKGGRRVGRFTMEDFTSDAFNQSSAGGTAWLGGPQAVGCLEGHLPCFQCLSGHAER